MSTREIRFHISSELNASLEAIVAGMKDNAGAPRSVAELARDLLIAAEYGAKIEHSAVQRVLMVVARARKMSDASA